MTWTHSAWFHGLLALGASLLSFAITWVVDALHNGTLTLGPGLAVFVPLLVGLLTICGVALRNWIESQQKPPA